MSPDATRRPAGTEIERLRSVRARLGTRATAHEIEEALELACAKLMTLESRLEKAQMAARVGHARPRDAEVRVRVLLDEVNSLREEISGLRAASSGPNRSALAEGFVLPTDPHQRPSKQ